VKSALTVVHLAAVVALTVACSGSSNPSTPGMQAPPPAMGLNKVNHIIIVMLENHSFDNYFGALAYAPGSPYHTAAGGCAAGDNACVDGLACSVDPTGTLTCSNSNPEDDGTTVVSFHDKSRCVIPDLGHSWSQSHMESNFSDPNNSLMSPLNDGFVRVNDTVDQLDNGVESATDDQTMGFYTQDDLPLYYDLAQKFAISDRYFAAVPGPTLPNRLYGLAATSFGHVDTGDTVPTVGYKPITGSIFDLLDSKQVSWADYSENGAWATVLRQRSGATDPHYGSVQSFLAQAAGQSGAGQLPQMSLVEPAFGGPQENDDHPPTDVGRGQAFISSIVNAVRNGPYWQDSVIFITYDEHGGFYDHVKSPAAPQGGASTPDGISPGQCADLSNPPGSTTPGGGVGCDGSTPEAKSLCPALAQNPTGPYPVQCATFNQLGFRVPLLVVSPFAKPQYISHAIADHTSLLAFIEARFLSDAQGGRLHLTLRDQYADPLEDLFDFDNAPSMNTALIQAQLPITDCTPAQ
jgi:phospholipase C